MKNVITYEPRLKVTLYKTVGRKSLGGKAVTSDRFQGTVAQQRIDLTPYLGDGASVRTSKSIRDPAGSWQLQFGDQGHKAVAALETLYGLIEPMDMVEIRMRHGVGAGQPPVVMRGFVSDVARMEAMSPDGRPSRSVSVSGQDYGKIWQIMQILYRADYIVGQNYISDFKLFERFGQGLKTVYPVKDFVSDVIKKLVNVFLDKMLPEQFPMPREIQVAESSVLGTTSPGIQGQEGTVYDLLRRYTDVGPWNELFMEDREDGVYCVFRANPFLSATDSPPKKIQETAPDPEYVDMDAVDVVSISTSRSDSNVANYYWVEASKWMLGDDWIRRSWGLTGPEKETVDFSEYPNSQTKLYGTRMMTVESMTGKQDMTTHNTGGDDATRGKQVDDMSEWLKGRRKVVSDSNKDNVILERGTIRLRGNEELRSGRYLRLKRGSTVAIYYLTHVEHEFVPFAGYWTTVQFERGTGFVERVRNGGSPYLGEMGL